MLKEKIQEELKTALKEKKEVEVSVLRMLLAAIASKETEKRTKVWKEEPDLSSQGLEEKSKLDDEEITEAVLSEVKKRKEAILEFEKGEREDLIEKEKKELEVLQKYLPEQISEEELRKLAKEAIEKVEAKEQKDMGKVMAELMPKTKGRVDGSLVSKIVKELLSSEN